MRELVSLTGPRMLAVASRMLNDAAEAEDVVQEVFARVWRHAPSWRPGAAGFDTWMHRVAMNLCYDRLRRRRDAGPDGLDALVDETPSAHATLNARDVSARVGEALAALPERQRAAIVLHHYQELSNIEAAALMEISVEALESLLARARRALRAALAGEAHVLLETESDARG